MKQIYFAGPLFTNAEREWNEKLVTMLKNDLSNFKFWFPQEEIGTETDPKKIFNLCTNAIKDSDIILAIMDGPDPDSGTCFECGYAYGLGKTIYTVRTDFRVGGDTVTGFNLMLTESSKVIHIENFSTTEKVAEKILNELNK
jgi:nucleoside 2-deoxyribosyltransferase